MEDEQNEELNQSEETNQSQVDDQNEEAGYEDEMEPVTTKQVAMKWGLYLGMIMVVYGLSLNMLDLLRVQSLNYVNYIFIAGLMYMAHKTFKDEGNGYMSYSQGLGLGTLVVVVGSFLSTVFSYIYVKFIDPAFMETIKEIQYEQMQEQGLSEGQIDQAMEMSAPFMTAEVMFPIAFVATVFFGFIISLIVSAITKNPDPATQV